MQEAVSQNGWAQMLREVSERNTGRHTMLEIADPEMGAQWAEIDLPLQGIAYDPLDHRIEIMVGESGPKATHLTHSIAGATGVDLLAGSDGQDAVLCIAHADGQTLLRFV